MKLPDHLLDPVGWLKRMSGSIRLPDASLTPAGMEYWMSKNGGKPTDGVAISTVRGTDSMNTHQSEEPSFVPYPWGINVLVDTDTGRIVKIDMAHNHFVITRSQLRWKKVKAVLLGAFVAAGCALGWNYGAAATQGVAKWYTAPATHYSQLLACANCGKGKVLKVPVGTKVADFVNDAICRRCGILGGLSKTW